MNAIERETLKAQHEADSFNERVEVGTMCHYWPGKRWDVTPRLGRTRTAASVLSGHTPVVWIEGYGGCIALSHVEPLG